MCKYESQIYAIISNRIPADELQGINSLIDRKHYGVAEKHAVTKLRMYVEKLEEELGISKYPKTAKPVWVQESELSGRISTQEAVRATAVKTITQPAMSNRQLVRPI